MPWKPMGPCAVHGCSGRAELRGRCAKHAAQAEKLYRQQHPDTRPSARERGYGSAWAKIRRNHLVHHPICVMCEARGSHVDHILPRVQGGTDDESNLQTLCARCHSRKTATVDGGFGNRVRG